MKRSWTTLLLIVGLTGLLVLLGGLQYRWLSQISESDGEKARKRVQEQTDHFAADFNREIQSAYFNLQTDAQSWKAKDWADFNDRYDFWKGKTAYPELISDIYFFEANPEASPLHYDRSARSFAAAEITPELAEIRKRSSDEKTFKPVYEDTYTLVLPVHDVAERMTSIMARTHATGGQMLEKPPEKFGYLVIRLDPSAIKEKILPDLNAKYFGDGEYRAAIVDTAGQPVYQSIKGDTSDAKAPLLDLSTDNYMFFENRELMSTLQRRKEPPVDKRGAAIVLNSHVETHTFNRVNTSGNEDGTIKVEIKRDKTPGAAVFTTTTDGAASVRSPWTLLVQHSSGSLDTYLTNTLRRNLAIGFGILFLLAAAVALIIISAQRAKMLAQRQVDFVSSVSHEFRTPLAVIYSAGENLADGVAKEDAQVSRYGNLIKGEGRKLSGMVEQILNFAGANSGRRKYNFAENSVAAIVDDALAECRPMLADKEISVETKVSETLPSIRADCSAMSQAIQNLIVNSVKYGNGEKWLRVTAENGGGRVKISVEDRGIGISKSDLKQIFEPFYRSREVVDAQIHGNGLGLSLVKQIAQAHNGRVFASSEVGKGSKFTIELPNG